MIQIAFSFILIIATAFVDLILYFKVPYWYRAKFGSARLLPGSGIVLMIKYKMEK